MAELGKLLPVVCVFAQPPPADLRAALERAGFQVIAFAHFSTFWMR